MVLIPGVCHMGLRDAVPRNGLAPRDKPFLGARQCNACDTWFWEYMISTLCVLPLFLFSNVYCDL